MSAVCRAPSLEERGTRDARTAQDLRDCRFTKTGYDSIGDRCGQAGFETTVTLARLEEAVMPLDAETEARARATVARGKAKGRNPRTFALVGDSITESPKFLRPFADANSVELSDEVRFLLSLPAGGSIVDHYRGANLVAAFTAFDAPRAARIGAHASWALPRGGDLRHTPLGQVVHVLSPSVAVVMFGSNDATRRFTSLDALVADFRARMTRIVDFLESEGVVPVLNTIPRHMFDGARKDCDASAGDMSNWRLAVQTSALSAVVAEIACARKLPLIDLRHALDATSNSGIGPDGVHPNAYKGGAGVLTAAGLQCGYNVRNYVTLRMLALLQPLLVE